MRIWIFRWIEVVEFLGRTCRNVLIVKFNLRGNSDNDTSLPKFIRNITTRVSHLQRLHLNTLKHIGSPESMKSIDNSLCLKIEFMEYYVLIHFVLRGRMPARIYLFQSGRFIDVEGRFQEGSQGYRFNSRTIKWLIWLTWVLMFRKILILTW